MLLADVMKLLLHMESCGIRAYVVGGAVRDMLMGKEPVDYDIAAECLPEKLCEVFSDYKTFDTGIRFGTLNVYSGARFVEITCCRRESGYSDLRRPDSVEFCENIEEDLARRDFTVNAMAMSVQGEIIDPFGGEEDIKRGVIRAVGNPERRFSEDALRILRVLRFASTLGFDIEEKTKAAIHEKKHLLTSVSGERIFSELSKLLLGENVLSVLMEYSAEICTFIPELSPCIGLDQRNPYHIYTVYEHIARSVAASPRDINIRLCMLFHDISKPDAFTVDEKGIGHFYGHPALSAEKAKRILRRLRADNETVKRVCFLVEYHDVRPPATRKSLHKYLLKVGFEGARELLRVRRADLSAQSPEHFGQFDYLDKSERIIEELELEVACVCVADLKINGDDLCKLGISEGKRIGEMLKEILEKVAREEVKNERETLIALAKRMKERK